jgi:hypothetical protein
MYVWVGLEGQFTMAVSIYLAGLSGWGIWPEELAGPSKKVQKTALLLPEEAGELGKPDALRVEARVGLDAPAQVVAAPGTQPVAARRIP